MRSPSATLILIGALALSACGSETSVDAKNESVESVANKVAASGMNPRPGRWQASLKIDSMEMPGMPAAAKQAMNKSLGAAQNYFTCLTPEQANRPNAEFFQKTAKNCKYDHFTMADGKIDAAMTCDAGGNATKMAMLGSYSGDVYDLKVTSQGEMQKGMPMNMAMSITSRRVGECNGTERQ
jgi:hypothetical protein